MCLCAPASCDELQLGKLDLLQTHFYRIKSVTTVLNFIRRGFMFSGVLPCFKSGCADVVCTCKLSCGLNVHVSTSMSWCVQVCDLLFVGTCKRIHAFIALFSCQSASLSHLYMFGAVSICY